MKGETLVSWGFRQRGRHTDWDVSYQRRGTRLHMVARARKKDTRAWSPNDKAERLAEYCVA